MLIFAWLAGCAQPVPVAEPVAPEPAPAPAPVAVVVENAEDLAKVLSAPKLELGSCRSGAVRVEGVRVARADDPAHQVWLKDLLDAEAIQVAAIAAGVLFDERVPIEGEALESLGALVVRLQEASAEDLDAYGCRRLKGVRPEGHLWNARGDALALLAKGSDKEAARAALGDRPDETLRDVTNAALGDAEALAKVTERAFRQLCDERDWETTWMLRALDSGTERGSLIPLGMQSTGGCDYLAETGEMPKEGATSAARPKARVPGGGH